MGARLGDWRSVRYAADGDYGALAIDKPLFILFVPSYGNGGTGEFVRAVTLAQAVVQRWPQVRIEFLLPGGPGTRQDAPFPKTCHEEGKSTRAGFNNEHIARLRPDLVIFDLFLPGSTLRLCHRLGIRTAFISCYAVPRRRAFRIDRLLLLDEHWHQREHLTGPVFTAGQRFLSRLSPTRRLSFDTYLATTQDADDTLPPEIAARLARPFVLLSAGGGGYRIDGRPVGEMFVEAAEKIHAASGIECLTQLGPLYEGTAAGSRTLTLKEVSQSLFSNLMRRAQVVVCNGGHSLNQALASGAACVATPLGGADQPPRIAAYASAGLILGSAPTVEALASSVLALLDPATNARQREQVARLGVVNGIPVMCDAIARLLPGLG